MINLELEVGRNEKNKNNLRHFYVLLCRPSAYF